MKYEFSPKAKLIGYTIGFAAGVYSLFFSDLIMYIDTPFKLAIGLIWYLLMGACTLSNAWGMLHQAELWQTSEKTQEAEA